MIDIEVDDRERQSGVLEHLLAIKSVRVCVRRLTAGDYLVGNRVLFERKTMADFFASIVDGRLFRQGQQLARSHFRPILILEGSAIAPATGGVSRESIQGSLLTLTLFFGIACLRTRDPAETAQLLGYAGEQVLRNISGGVCRHGYRPSRRRNRQLFILQGLPGIGPTRAERLLEQFGSIEAVFEADAEDLAAVPGIGRKTAEAIRDLIGPEIDDSGGPTNPSTSHDDPSCGPVPVFNNEPTAC
jgi:ERCC4-type nuclease